MLIPTFTCDETEDEILITSRSHSQPSRLLTSLYCIEPKIKTVFGANEDSLERAQQARLYVQGVEKISVDEYFIPNESSEMLILKIKQLFYQQIWV